MSGSGFHVHGPHEHEFDHAVSQGSHAGHAAESSASTGHRLTSRIAVCTAVIATVGAIFSYMAGATQANAGLYKNSAAIKKTEAANQWSFFQAKSTKQSLAEIAGERVPGPARGAYRDRVQRYEKEKDAIQRSAQDLDRQAQEWDRRSAAVMHEHHRWAQATTALQVAIAMAAMALLTRKKWLEWGMFGLAGIGLAIGAAAVLHL